MLTMTGDAQVADGEPRDLLGRRDVALHDDGRDEQQIGDVVEAARRVVGGQQQLEIELARQVVEREQVADRVAVLGARQPPERRHARRGCGCAAAAVVERAFEISRCAQIRGTIGARIIGRHRLCAQLADDLFPMLRRCGDLFDFGGVDDELRREIDRVMTIGAIAAEQVAGGGRIVVVPAQPPRGAERHGREDEDTDEIPLHGV